ncbi:MAG: TonB-dependent receptor, partial [Vicinamibacterales bacterium]
GNGQYQIIDLRPGVYSMTFTLPGFSTVKRDGIELAGSFTATVNAELRVGSLEETITVTGDSPIVDVQSVGQQQVLGKDVIDNIPSSRTHFSLAAMIPAMNTSNSSDIGGTNSISLVFLTAHGGRSADQRVMIDGLSTHNAEGAGQYSGYLPNTGSTQEIAIDYAGGGAEMLTGGVRVNLIPRDGGNTFRGNIFASGMGGTKMQGSNYDQDLKNRGLTTPNEIRKLWDVNPGGGGPVVRDKVWWYGAYRWNGEDNYAGGFFNKNAGIKDIWTYEPDPTKRTANWHEQKSLNARVTWQLNQKNKVSFFYDKQFRCVCQNNLTAVTSPEAGSDLQYPYTDFSTLTWTSPVTSRLLFEAGASYHPERWRNTSNTWAAGEGPLRDLIGVTDQANNRVYHGRVTPYGSALTVVTNARAAVSYVTGSHAVKVGFFNSHATRERDEAMAPEGMFYRFNNGVPNQITQRTKPDFILENIGMDLGVFAQDKWTLGRLTANLGVRFDRQTIYFPEQHLGSTVFIPDRDISFSKLDWVDWKDFSPRLGAVYDVFGNGKTAVRVSLNKYMQAFGLQGLFGDGSNPINLLSNTVTRSWNDSFYPVGDPRRGNYVPDCDLRSPLGNEECGPMSDQNFGKQVNTLSVDPAILRGWGARGANWEFSTGIQHEVVRGVSADVAYFRRSYQNFIAIDNRATTLADYTQYSITAPVDSRLPGGGGYTVGSLYDLNPNKVGVVDDYVTFASNYGKQTEYWHGVDVGINTRLPHEIVLQGGVSTGRTVTDNCEVVAKSPEISSGLNVASGTATVPRPSAQITPQGNTTAANVTGGVTYCHQATNFLTAVKALGSYNIPKIDVQTSMSFQNNPGSVIYANYTATNAIVSPSLGRNLTGAANVPVNLVKPGTMYGDRVNQLDFRVAKILRFGRSRTSLSLDIFNLLNVNPVQSYSIAYATWLQPQRILQARFIKLGMQLDF